MGKDSPLKTILVVDDSPTARAIVLRCLKGLGYGDVETRQAEHGEEALEMIRESRPDLVVTDLNMPVMDGVSMLRRIKSSPKLNDIPVIVVSSILDESRVEELKASGVEFLVHKPIKPPLLGAAIDQIVKELEE